MFSKSIHHFSTLSLRVAGTNLGDFKFEKIFLLLSHKYICKPNKLSQGYIFHFFKENIFSIKK